MADSETPGRYLGAYALCRDPSGRLLLARLAPGLLDEGLWTMPGGGVEWGEPPDGAVLRELEEETGIVDVRDARVAAVFSNVFERSAERPHDPFHVVGLIYEVTPGSFDLRPEFDGSTDRCEWFTEQQARELPLVPIARFAVDLAWPKR
ncbi:MAG: NUDIX domain-containing protein [Spirochaetaceae bacterium]|nr:NUDIX domain-containing protein [Spirochaetaceae bacterium]